MPFSIRSSLNRLHGRHCRPCKTDIYNPQLPNKKKIPQETISFQSLVEKSYTATICAKPYIIKRSLHVIVGQPITVHLTYTKNKHEHEHLYFDWGKPERRNLDFQKEAIDIQEDRGRSWELAERVSPEKGKKMVIKRGFVVTPVDTDICRSVYPSSPTRYWKAKHSLWREYVDL
ncbi:uncharacterized protein EAF01_001136 [Botrytis porri]|uniref:uncharacterized protein n=1 Tax=Botrytis porri TaxID=87229 RepID=UPI0019008024|nr:uncharacterized protein EAF01_001136 [Botrytis porri]KAF7912115.1 hypothetical protein EAF01_001136 [Botrytis porri]